MKGKQGRLWIISLFFSLVVFGVVWVMFAGKQIAGWAQRAIELNNLTGLEAFLLANLNLWVFLFMLITIIVAVSIAKND